MIDTSLDSIRVFAIMVLGIVWLWLLNHPEENGIKRRKRN